MRNVGGRGETSHVTLEWKGGYGVGGQKGRKEMEKEMQYNPILYKSILFFFLKKEKHITRNLSSFSLVPPLCLSYSFPSI